MNNVLYRTEDIKDNEILNYFVESKMDRDIIESLKSKSPILLMGSRGNGKTMLLKVAEQELDKSFNDNRTLSVIVSFKKAGFLHEDESDFFNYWMMSKILIALKRKLRKITGIGEFNLFQEYYTAGLESEEDVVSKLVSFSDKLEKASKKRTTLEKAEIKALAEGIVDDIKPVSEIEYFQEIIEELCESTGIDRIILFFDEACHNFIPYQQREFFTLFRDLRSPYISCKAAVYPGLTSFGTFQPFHDAELKTINRDILNNSYIKNMREILEKQMPEESFAKLLKTGQLLSHLIYASSGNPRLLLKSVFSATNEFKIGLKTNIVNETIKNFYRNDIWSEHTKIADLYNNIKPLVNWGRDFIEDVVVPDTISKNYDWALKEEESRQTCFFCIHRDAPESVKKAMRLLEYSGVVILHTQGTKVRKAVYDRYLLNIGIMVSQESNPSDLLVKIMPNLSVKLYTDYGMNSSKYPDLGKINGITDYQGGEEIIKIILQKSVNELDLTDYQKRLLIDAGIITIEQVLSGSESDLMKVPNVGEKRSRKIWNSAYNSVIEYVSG